MNRVLASSLALLAAACAGSQSDSASGGGAGAGGGGVSFGGQQDIGEFRGILEAGQIPGPETLDANGFFNEHYAPPPATGCTQPVCLTPGVAVGRDWLTGAHQATLQVAVSTNVDPTTITRKPLNLVVVVDRSGSMWEDDRISKVKVGLHTLVDNLAEGDRLALVQFDDQVDVLAPFTESSTTDRAQLHTLIDTLTPRGSTNIYGGLELGFELASEAFSAERQNRVIFLSDGLATAGNTSPDAIISMTDGYVERGIGLTTIGVGLSFDVALMRGLAEHGSGNFYFLEDAAAANEVFTQELDYFVTPLALDVRVEATVGTGWRLGEVVGSTLWNGSSAAGSLRVPAVFVASRVSQSPEGGRRGGGSMLFINLTPTGIADASGKVAELKLTYRLPGTSETITESVTLAYPDEPSATPAETYLSVPEMAERYAMYNVFLGLRFATRSYSASCAAAALRATRTAAETWNATHEDPDIAADIDLIDLYLANLAEQGATGEADLASCGADNPYGEGGYHGYGHDHGHAYGCQATRSSTAGILVVLLTFVLIPRRRRH